MCDELKKLQDTGGSIRRIIKRIGEEENIQGRKGNGMSRDRSRRD